MQPAGALPDSARRAVVSMSADEPWHAWSPGEVVSSWASDATLGLTPIDASDRQAEYSPNASKIRLQNPWQRILLR
jgi:hypothetical protein